ncbi:hypothetical protein CEP54_002095 [Fusarium duplospermum]|uniref:Uncharacterized protein n=1 Tax=Fusarium duplospermum TaxID=1325734 RepID=A0A428QWP0_9HYPO|nr:hypothetical protein CEP54_002095 [Fusarium duplospermum]
MYFQTAIPTPSEEQPCCLVIIRLPSGVCLMQDVGDLFASKIGGAQRMYYRSLLLQTSAVSVVDVAKVGNNPMGPNYDVIVHDNGLDETLTKALHKPESLANVPSEVFMANYPGLLIQGGPREFVPQKAVMIHFTSDPTAQRIAGMMFSGLLSGIGALIKILVA